MARKLNFTTHEEWGTSYDSIEHIQYSNLYFYGTSGESYDWNTFHAGPEYIEWEDIERIYGPNYVKDIKIYQSEDGIPSDDDPVFAIANINHWKFDIQRPKKSTPQQKPAQESSNNWKKLTCSRFRTRKLPDGKWEISYIE